MNELNEKQKIELGRRAIESVSCYFEWNTDNIVYANHLLIRVADSVLNKIQELTQNSENIKEILLNPTSDNTQLGRYQIGTKKLHTCGVCCQGYSPDVLKANFEICPDCQHAGRVKEACQDKNGNVFTSGMYLKNEASSATVQILKISETEIIDDKNGATEIQDFINAGWIVHERVTPYRLSDDEWDCMDDCKFIDAKIGSIECFRCDQHKKHNEDQQWVVCELYNKENGDGI